MTHTKTLLTACAIILLFANCNKNITDPLPDDLGLPKTYTEDIKSSYYGNSTTTYNLTFDSDKRLLTLVSQSNPGDKMVYTYSNSTYSLEIFNSGTLSIHENFFLNANSLLDSTLQYNDTHDSSTEKYFYNGARQLVKLIEYDYTKATGGIPNNTHNYTYDNEGNQLTDIDDNISQTYTYYTDHSNVDPLNQPYLPTPKHPLKTVTIVSGGQTASVAYTYTYDAKGRVLTERQVVSTGDTVLKTYTY